MCIQSCIDFTRDALDFADISEKAVLEVGALDVNGSVRSIVGALGPASYLGVDIEAGPGVDELADVHSLVERYGKHSFDVVISTEMLEHIKDWRSAIENLKGVVRPGGVLLITTRSPGFKYHGYPFDYWRYTPEDMTRLLRDFEIEDLQNDPLAPGVFVKARRPVLASSGDVPVLDGYPLFSIIRNGPAVDISDGEVLAFLERTKFQRAAVAWTQGFGSRVLPEPIKSALKRMTPRKLWQ